MRKTMLFLVLLFVVGSSTMASATSAETRKEEQEALGQESMGQIMDKVLMTQPNLDEITAWFNRSMDGAQMEYDAKNTFPSYDELSWDFMRSAYQWMFRLHPSADWIDTMIYSWGVTQWGGSNREEFAKREGLTEAHASGFWFWRQELLRQAGLIMNDQELVMEFYDKYKNTVVNLNRWHKNFALKKAIVLLSVIQGTHELCPYLTIAWHSELRDGAYYGLYNWIETGYKDRNYEVRHSFHEVVEWFYFMERRREIGGDDVIVAYEMIVTDFIDTLSSM